VRQALVVRLNSWELVAELQGDFSGWDRIFSTHEVGVESGRLVRMPSVAPEAQPNAQTSDRVTTSLAATADVQCEATFDGARLDMGVLGIEFLVSEVSGYSFLLIPVSPMDSPADGGGYKPEPSTLLVIQRDGQTLRETRLLRRDLANNAVVLHALRQGERLQIQVNDLPPMEMFDPFPLPTSQPGRVALRWGPKPEGLLRLVMSQWRQPTAPSPLEVADQLYASGEFRDALRKYEDQAKQSRGSEYEREAEYKQGLCLQQLGRLDDAQQVFERLSNVSVDRWNTLADFQLWARALETKQADRSEAIYLRLSEKYSFEDLSRIAPDSIRRRIAQFSTSELSNYERYLFYDPNRLAKSQRAFDVLALLEPGSEAYGIAAGALIRDAEVLGRHDLALQVLHQMARNPWIWAFDVMLFEVLRNSGKPEAALEEVEKLVQSGRLSGRQYEGMIAHERACCLHALGRIGEAREIVSIALPPLRALSAEVGEPSEELSYLLRTHAVLQEDAGNHETALAAWRELAGHVQLIKRDNKQGTRIYYTARAMSGEIDDADAEHLIEFGAAVDRRGLAQILLSYVPREKLVAVVKGLWSSPRAIAVTRKIALGEHTTYAIALSFPTLAAYQFLVSTFPAAAADPQQEEAFWAFSQHSVRLLSMEGTLQRGHLLPLGMTWKGNAGFLGWSTVQGTLPAEYRGEMAYIFGLRFQQLGQPAEARKFFQTTVRDTAPDSLFARLAARELGAMGD
jgi:tetratricopeptide (TPR) repeat protein